MKVTKAIVRPPSAAFTGCISEHPLHHTVNLERALQQHAQYVTTLEELGLEVIVLEPQPSLPDACFVEDTAVVYGNRAFITRPKPQSRRDEISTVRPVLEQYFDCEVAEAPATIEGGDVIHLAHRLISGLSQRTNQQGVMQMSSWLGVPVDTIEAPQIMHLKSYLTAIDDTTFVGTGRFLDHPVVQDAKVIYVPDSEHYAANTLMINGRVLLPAGHPITAESITRAGYEVIELNMSEFQKCDGALTCLSITF
ncbi:MAG: N(G),N(G)-dimethylarginine dimethylaminohydrolase [Candidatus Thorarchaeota archaeon]|nr:N(G),N(G)-dimethylarginine dimethylaminohydrolase [Candidatus Thorarchaeota archaeon]